MVMGAYVKKLVPHLPKGTSIVMASSLVVVEDDRGFVLMEKRAEDGFWTIPGGGCEETDSYKQTAIKELKEETNLKIKEDDLEFLGIISDPKLETVSYANGGVSRYYAAVFRVSEYEGELNINDDESLVLKFVGIHDALTNYELMPDAEYILRQLVDDNIPFIN